MIIYNQARNNRKLSFNFSKTPPSNFIMSENQFAILISNVSKTVDIQNEENLNAIEKLKNFFLNQ